MARTIANYTVTADGRDKGKKFIITEMAPRVGHRWACRALLAMGAAGADIAGLSASSGMAGVASLGFQAFIGGINPDTAQELLDELLTCVTVNHGSMERALIEDDIDEIMTIFSLQKEVFMLHVVPFTSAAPSTSVSTGVPEAAAS